MKTHLVDADVLEALRMASQRDPKPHAFEHTCTLHWDAFVFFDECRSDFDLAFVDCETLVDHNWLGG